jgi:hypothetical protein
MRCVFGVIFTSVVGVLFVSELGGNYRTSSGAANWYSWPVRHRSEKEYAMNAKQMMLGAAAIGCFVTMTMSVASAQQQDSINGRANERVGGNRVETSGQLNAAARQGGNHFANGPRMSEGVRETQGTAQDRTFRGERRVATENRYTGQWRGDRRELDRLAVERDGGAWRGDRSAYRGADRAVGVGAGVATGGYTWEPGYYAYSGYAPNALYAYAPGYNVGPYYDYAPGFSVGIGPVGVSIGPYWD